MIRSAAYILAFLSFVPGRSMAQTSCQEARSSSSLHHGKRSSTATRSDSIDLLHHRIELDLTSVGQGEIHGRCQLRFTPLVTGVTELKLDLLDLTVDSVTTTTGPLSFLQVAEVLDIDLGPSQGLGDTLEVTVHYGGDPATDASGFGGFYTNGGIAYNLGVAFTAQPHSFGRAWFPCFDNFVERSTFEFVVTTTGGRSAWCNGHLISQSFPGGDTVVTHWALDETMPAYLASVASANYSVVRDTFPTQAGGAVPVDLVALPGDTSAMKASFVHLSDAFACFEERLGDHRWERIGYVLTPVGAMEHATNIAYPRSIADGSTTYETTMAHELAHHWFGDLVTCKRAEEMYLNEGFAEFLSYVFEEHVYGRNAYMQLVRENHRAMVHRAHLLDEGWWPLADVPQDRTYGEHSYNKGADVLHTLRGYLGDSLMFAGLRDFLSAFAFQAVGTTDLRDHLSQVTGVDLTAFFDDWVLQPGWAAFEVDSFVTAQQGGVQVVTVHVEQKLRGAIHLFSDVPLTFTCTAADGSSWTTPDSLLVGGSQSSVSFNAPFVPVHVALNVDERISLAITSDTDTLSASGIRGFSNANLRLTWSGLGPSLPIRLEQYWVSPDPVLADPWSITLATDRWWRIQADIPPSSDIDGRITFDARPTPFGSLDPGLTQSQGTTAFHEDSLVLLHRADASMPWTVHAGATSVQPIGDPMDGYGFLDFTDLVQGDYALGWRHGTVAITEHDEIPVLQAHPNPANELLTVDLTEWRATAMLFLRDMTGRVILREPATSPRVRFNVAHLPAGTYMLELHNGERPMGATPVVLGRQ